jgi:hypothetical protein
LSFAARSSNNQPTSQEWQWACCVRVYFFACVMSAPTHP